MTAADVIARVAAAGVQLRVEEGILRARPATRLTDELRTLIRLNKPVIVDALSSAQKLGYAETDPSGDVDGIDSAAKLVILANWAMGRKCTIRDVAITGIRAVTSAEISRAKAAGKVVKLIASIDGGLKVEPTELDRQNPLAVSGVLNAVTFFSEFAGEETVVGRGAGGPETASAIVRDLLEIKENMARTGLKE